MKIPVIIDELRRLNVGVKTKHGQIILTGGKDKVSQQLLNEIKDNKPALIEYIESCERQPGMKTILKQNNDEYFPLTAQQKSIWLASQNHNTAILYNQPSMFIAKGELCIDALKYSINKIVKRHESLRMTFAEINGEPQQKVLKDVDMVVDFNELDERKNITDIYKEFSTYVFDLSKPPLLKCLIAKRNEHEHYLLFNTHHIVSDGWSVNIFFRELLENYSLFLKNGDKEEHVDQSFSFKEFVDFQTDYVESEKGKIDLEFWKEKIDLDYSPTKLSSKTDYDGLDYYAGDYSNSYLPDKIRKEVNTVCKSKKVTPFHFYSTVLTLLLRKYTCNKTISFGTPFACRSDIKYKDAIGCFINTLPIIINSDQAVTFDDLLKSVTNEITEVYNHQNYPAEKIVENIKLSNTNYGSPLFDIIIVYQNYSLSKINMDGLEISYLETPIEKSKAGLVLRIFEENDKLLINIEYSKKIFDSIFIKQMFRHFEALIKNVLANPSASIDEIEYLTGGEKSALFSLLDNSHVHYPKDKTVLDYLSEQLKKQKDKVAVTINGKNISYAELDEKSTILANYLKEEQNVSVNDIVGISTGRNENLIIGIIAILKAGAAYLPINPDYPDVRKQLILNDSECNIILADDVSEDKSHPYLSIDKILKEDKYTNKRLTLKTSISHSDPAYIIYTSGSTGKPKGVVVSHENLLRLFFNDEQIFNFNENDVWTLFHSYSFDFSVWEIFGALLFGGRLVIVPDEITKDPSAYYDLLAKESVTILNQTPSAFYRLLIDEGKRLSLRYIIFGGEALQPNKLQDWKLQYPGIKIINMYGITETTVHVTYKEITDEDIKTGISNIGKPIPTMGICVLDKNLSILPQGIPGQICVYGEGLSKGYLNQPELTFEKFKNILPFGLCYLSGDVGRILENGDIEYLGRRDDQVQLHGFRIELCEIENALIKIEGIKEAVVLVAGNENDISLTAFLVSDKKITNDFIRKELTTKIPGYMIPSNFLFVDAIPLTPNGKIDKQTLLKLRSSENKKIVVPVSEVERKILEAWKETLGDIGISTDESFFSIGGDSIKALKLVREINKKVNIGLTIAELYENDTIKKIAAKSIDNDAMNFDEEVRKELLSIENMSNELIHKNDLSKTIEQILPMSDIQRGMIYYSFKNPDSAIYHDQFVYQIYAKDFSFDVYKKSLSLMIDKHSMLRTSFNMFDYSEDVQLIYKTAKPNLLYEDLTGTKKNVIEKTVNDYVATERKQKFNIANPPLWRMKIFKAPGDIIIICWSFHHALFDGWSNASFFTELLSIYKGIINNSDYKPSLLRSSYRHYIAEQNVIKRKNEAVNFWKNELADYKRLELPKKETDNTVSEIDEYYLQIDSNLVSKLKKDAVNLGTEIKTIFFSAYIYCMSLFTYDNDLLVGIVTNNHPAIEDSEKILGCFLNTVPFRINVDSSQTWKEFILSVISKINIQKKYEVLSLFEIVKNIGAPIGDSNPLFDVFFNYVDFNIYENIYDDYSLESHGIKEYNLNGFGKTNMPLDFTIANTFNKCNLHISYNSDSISSNWVKRLGDYFNRLLHLIAEGINDSQVLLKDISLVDIDDIQLLASYNNTKKRFDENNLTVTHLYSEQLKNNKNKIGILFDEDSKPGIKYTVFDKNVNKLAGKILSSINSKPGGLIGVVSERNEFMIYAVMAILKSGNGYVPVDPYVPEERAKYVIEDCGCSVILCENKFKDFLHNVFAGEIVVIEEILAENLPLKEITFPQVAESAPLFLLYTSGSTGKPKGVLMPHKPIMNLFFWMREEYMVENERILFLNPYTFDMSIWGLYAWAVNGSSVCVLKHDDEKDPFKIFKAVNEKSITTIHFVPSMLAMFLEYIEKHSINMRNTKLRYIFVSGEVLNKHLIDKFKKCFEGSKAELINFYGPTEAHVVTHFRTNKLDEINHTVVPIGKPISNTKILIVDKEMRIVPQGILGEILLGGDCLADGYLNKELLTKEKFITLENELTKGRERFYRTGDLGRWLSDGNIEFLGRNDFQIKIRGFRVEPGEVQAIINKINGVKESLVVVRERVPGDKSLIAYVVYEENEKYDEGFIKEELKKQVADYMVPSVIIGMDKFPLTSNGKIDRKMLPEPELSKVKRNIVTPRNKFEKRIAEIWSEVLKIDNIGINDNFFDLGGHSLLIIRVHSEIEKEIDKKIEVVDLFKYPTIALLSEFITCGNGDSIIIDKAMQRAENQKNARKKRSINLKKKGRANE